MYIYVCMYVCMYVCVAFVPSSFYALVRIDVKEMQTFNYSPTDCMKQALFNTPSATYVQLYMHMQDFLYVFMKFWKSVLWMRKNLLNLKSCTFLLEADFDTVRQCQLVVIFSDGVGASSRKIMMTMINVATLAMPK